MALLLISLPDAEEIPRVCVWSNCPDVDERVGDNGPALNEFEVVRVIHADTRRVGLPATTQKPTIISQVLMSEVCTGTAKHRND